MKVLLRVNPPPQLYIIHLRKKRPFICLLELPLGDKSNKISHLYIHFFVQVRSIVRKISSHNPCKCILLNVCISNKFCSDVWRRRKTRPRWKAKKCIAVMGCLTIMVISFIILALGIVARQRRSRTSGGKCTQFSDFLQKNEINFSSLIGRKNFRGLRGRENTFLSSFPVCMTVYTWLFPNRYRTG